MVAIHPQIAVTRINHTAKQRQQGGFARIRRPDNERQFAFVRLEIRGLQSHDELAARFVFFARAFEFSNHGLLWAIRKFLIGANA